MFLFSVCTCSRILPRQILNFVFLVAPTTRSSADLRRRRQLRSAASLRRSVVAEWITSWRASSRSCPPCRPDSPETSCSFIIPDFILNSDSTLLLIVSFILMLRTYKKHYMHHDSRVIDNCLFYDSRSY